MNVNRIILCATPNASVYPIPDICTQDRTITLNKLGILQIFKNKKPTAQAWIHTNLPRLLLFDPHQKERFMNWFWNELPENGWLEFDFGRHTHSLCLLEKK